jgi:hypothetical protein
MHDNNCNILGHYCWTHQFRTSEGIPGWPKKGGSDTFVSHSPWEHNEQGGWATEVLWANGDTHSTKNQKPCAMCGIHCQYPVEQTFVDRDGYQEKNVRRENAL